MNTTQLKSAVIDQTTPTLVDSFETKVLKYLSSIDAKLDDLNEKVEAIEVRLSDMDLDTGGGFEID
jgi:hypothetical protein